MKNPKLLDLFCKAGGGAVGYHRAGFDVTGVDNDPQPRYPFRFYQADALEFVALYGHLFNVIHASPPCQLYSGFRAITIARFGSVKTDPPDLVDVTRQVLIETGKPWIIENVQGSPVLTQVIVCAASLGLPHLARHRHFESSVLLFVPKCSHRKNEYTIGIYGARPDGRRVSYKHHRLVRVANSLDEASREMGIDWMEWHEITQAIPPAYTEYLGRQLIRAVQ